MKPKSTVKTLYKKVWVPVLKLIKIRDFGEV